MPLTATDYFRYFPGGPELRRWGIGITAAGFTHVPPGSPYPPARHPGDHDFGWERGRVLDSLQIVLIVGGRGWFESKATGLRAIDAGTAFAVLPRTWHRYRPDPGTGWTESWIEVQGPVPDTLLRSGIFAPRSAVRVVPPGTGMEQALEAVHLRARAATGFDPELAAAGLAVLAAWDKSPNMQPARSRIVRAIAQAERHLSEHFAEPVNVAALAKSLGIAYSHFRREFKAHTGFAPWQYVVHLRLSRARRLLAAEDATLDDVAARLGFSSGFHLSGAFKRAFGTSPEHWRRSLASQATNPAAASLTSDRMDGDGAEKT